MTDWEARAAEAENAALWWFAPLLAWWLDRRARRRARRWQGL